LRLANFEETEIGGKAGDPEEIEKVDVGEEGNGREPLIELFACGGQQDVLLKAGEARDFVAFFEIGMTRFNDFGEAKGAQDFTDCDGRHVLGNVCHPHTHGWVNGEVFDASESLAVGDGGNGRFGELEDVGSDEAGWAIREFPLTIDGGHGERG